MRRLAAAVGITAVGITVVGVLSLPVVPIRAIAVASACIAAIVARLGTLAWVGLVITRRAWMRVVVVG